MELIIDWLKNLTYSLLDLSNFMITPLHIEGVGSITPLMFCTFGSLIIFLGVAIVKWVIS